MLIGLSRSFILVSTLKTASTSIEDVLKPYAEICLLESQFGKHMTVAQMTTNLAWLFAAKDVTSFFSFAVMRDPTEFVLSIYNSHQHPAFKDRAGLFTGAMSFDEFLEKWTLVNPEHVVPQHSRLLNRKGSIGVNYVIRFDRLKDGLRVVADRLGIPRIKRLPMLNASVGALAPRHLSLSQRRWIADRFANDQSFMDKYCGKLIMA